MVTADESVHDALMAGDAGPLLAQLRADPRAVCAARPQGRPWLHRAIEANHMAALKALLAAGANPNAQDAHGATPAFEAWSRLIRNHYYARQGLPAGEVTQTLAIQRLLWEHGARPEGGMRARGWNNALEQYMPSLWSGLASFPDEYRLRLWRWGPKQPINLSRDRAHFKTLAAQYDHTAMEWLLQRVDDRRKAAWAADAGLWQAWIAAGVPEPIEALWPWVQAHGAAWAQEIRQAIVVESVRQHRVTALQALATVGAWDGQDPALLDSQRQLLRQGFSHQWGALEQAQGVPWQAQSEAWLSLVEDSREPLALLEWLVQRGVRWTPDRAAHWAQRWMASEQVLPEGQLQQGVQWFMRHGLWEADIWQESPILHDLLILPTAAGRVWMRDHVVQKMHTLLQTPWGHALTAVRGEGQRPALFQALAWDEQHHGQATGYLIAAGADWQAMDEAGNTALHWAVFHRHPRWVAAWASLKHHANALGQTPLHGVFSAAQGPAVATLQALAPEQDDWCHADAQGQTPLHAWAKAVDRLGNDWERQDPLAHLPMQALPWTLADANGQWPVEHLVQTVRAMDRITPYAQTWLRRLVLEAEAWPPSWTPETLAQVAQRCRWTAEEHSAVDLKFHLRRAARAPAPRRARL